MNKNKRSIGKTRRVQFVNNNNLKKKVGTLSPTRRNYNNYYVPDSVAANNIVRFAIDDADLNNNKFKYSNANKLGDIVKVKIMALWRKQRRETHQEPLKKITMLYASAQSKCTKNLIKQGLSGLRRQMNSNNINKNDKPLIQTTLYNFFAQLLAYGFLDSNHEWFVDEAQTVIGDDSNRRRFVNLCEINGDIRPVIDRSGIIIEESPQVKSQIEILKGHKYVDINYVDPNYPNF
jgi:hypothetical protein